MNFIEKFIDGMCGKKDENDSSLIPDRPEWPEAESVKTISSTLSVGSKDFHGIGIKCKGMGDGSQKENQRPALRVSGKASNLILLAPGVDGIHCVGNTVLEKVVWDDIGEDGFTLHSTKLTLIDCMARLGEDKWGQINGPRSKKSITITAKGCYIEDVQRVFRLNGGSNARQHKLKLILDGCTFRDCRTILKVSTGTGRVEFKNCTFIDVREPWMGCEVKDKGGNKFLST